MKGRVYVNKKSGREILWSQDGTTLEPGSIVPATLKLEMAANTGSFSDIIFNVVISGSA